MNKAKETQPQREKSNRLALLWYAHPRIAILLSLVAINLAVILLFTAVLALLSGNGFLEELAYIFTYTMCSDGIYDFVNSQEDLACFIVKIVLTVVQMLIFSGALIGFSTDVIQSAIDRRLNNLGAIHLKGHYVFLNWSSIGPHIIYDLSFLEGEKNVVILCKEERADVINSIQNIFIENGKKTKGLRIFVKQGSPDSVKHLSDVSLGDARYVGVLAVECEDVGESSMSASDLCAVKTLFNILPIVKNANIVVETENADTVTKIESLLDTIDPQLNRRVIAFAHNRVLGHILGRVAVNSNYSALYHSLLSYDGCEFYGIPPMDVEEALQTFDGCIPIANYDDDDETDETGKTAVDRLYVLSYDKKLPRRKACASFVKPLPYRENVRKEDFTLFIFAETSKANFVVDELTRFNAASGSSIKVLSHTYQDDISAVIQEVAQTQGKKKILLLSDKSGNVGREDTDIFLSALALKLGGCLDENIEVLAEIVNPSNFNSLQNFGVMSVIVSNRIISLFMVQMLTHSGAKKFYRDIISTNGDNGTDMVDIDILKAEELFAFEGDTVAFSCKAELVQSFFAASGKTRNCIGVKFAGESEIRFLCDDMDAKKEIALRKSDELILVSYH